MAFVLQTIFVLSDQFITVDHYLAARFSVLQTVSLYITNCWDIVIKKINSKLEQLGNFLNNYDKKSSR